MEDVVPKLQRIQSFIFAILAAVAISPYLLPIDWFMKSGAALAVGFALSWCVMTIVAVFKERSWTTLAPVHKSHGGLLFVIFLALLAFLPGRLPFAIFPAVVSVCFAGAAVYNFYASRRAGSADEGA